MANSSLADRLSPGSIKKEISRCELLILTTAKSRALHKEEGGDSLV
jgi:hypothetical protein